MSYSKPQQRLLRQHPLANSKLLYGYRNYCYGYRNSYSYCYRNSYIYTYARTNGNSNCYVYADPNSYGDSNSYCYGDCYTNAYSG